MTHVRALAPGFDLLALQQRAPARYPLLLESVASGTAHGRWDMLLAADGRRLVLGRDGRTRREGASAGVDAPAPHDATAIDDDFLRALDAEWQAVRRPAAVSPWPFRGGWALLLGYELVAQVEPVLRLPMPPGALPVAVACRCPAAVLRDRASGGMVAVAEAGAEALLEALLADIADIEDIADSADTGGMADIAVSDDSAASAMSWPNLRECAEAPGDAYLAAAARALDYIRAGDVFQVNLSRGWEVRFDAPLPPAALYARLRRANPAPFAGLFDLGDAGAVVSASPERLVSVRGDLVETRPIAGTRPRLPGEDDAGRIRELIGHAKERAEHVMLVDLERNDLGRVCRGGSVEVDELMVVESYAHVHHIVSNVRGRLREDATPGAVLRAVFPGGTITGAPKVRCMEIIAELEGVGRGAYTGAMGWLDRSGDLDLNILIRSAEVAGDTLRFRTGAGIVADSDPAAELDETRAKARGMLQAIGA
ncbi:aminodeoxychorismate synthase component I [Luteimonas sp. MC1750]|uniref:aminodeoxychorismate synthase component I n=1 Tax=Luteimonas sp. MC1750 TaxID=2799326 RepID=UPI0018F0F37F|nr:aminodeoxychorismate synthase component I [Luteimonas sp. MC1750]MBJ6983137.1 aminodeoxychorismate synthase component I [Luteimonas sp. MC1750]QQO05156.1 aminodeoxychorismate synthase component I [Luteimonas sp. MC1750]